MSCPFCELSAQRIVFQNELAIALYDGYPVSDGHGLVIPKRHILDYWGLTEPNARLATTFLRLYEKAFNREIRW